jgi:hypothetical protein
MQLRTGRVFGLETESIMELHVISADDPIEAGEAVLYGVEGARFGIGLAVCEVSDSVGLALKNDGERHGWNSW